MAAGCRFQPIAVLLLLVQVPSCHAFGIPSIAIYALVAGGALFLVLTALLITICIKKCPCRKEGSDGDVKKKKPSSKKDIEKGKTKTTAAKRNGLFASSKKSQKASDKGAKKGEKVTKFKVKDEKKEKGGKKDKAQKEKDKKKDEKKQKKEDKKNKDKDKKDKSKKGKENDKDKNAKSSKAVNSWKKAVAKINTGKGSEVAPAKSAKVAWTIPVDAKEKPKKLVGFGRSG